MHRITGAKTFERKEIQNKLLHNLCRRNKLAKLRRCGCLKGLKHILDYYPWIFNGLFYNGTTAIE